MKGSLTWRKRNPSNCERIECPKVSAVMPVPSETKKAVRSGTLVLESGIQISAK
jgi:hypothetical protein